MLHSEQRNKNATLVLRPHQSGRALNESLLPVLRCRVHSFAHAGFTARRSKKRGCATLIVNENSCHLPEIGRKVADRNQTKPVWQVGDCEGTQNAGAVAEWPGWRGAELQVRADKGPAKAEGVAMLEVRRRSLIAGLSGQLSRFFYPSGGSASCTTCPSQIIRGADSPPAD
jgi:hypothetical protein